VTSSVTLTAPMISPVSSTIGDAELRMTFLAPSGVSIITSSSAENSPWMARAAPHSSGLTGSPVSAHHALCSASSGTPALPQSCFSELFATTT
jgi:hypothetical protein